MARISSTRRPTLDDFDRAILRIVQQAAKTPQRQIAERVNLSPAAVQRRVAAMIALWRGEPLRHAPTRVALIAQLFEFSKSEVRFADALLHGMGIEDAAMSLNLTVKTARQYSKQLYAKANARDRSDLIRKMADSVAGLV